MHIVRIGDRFVNLEQLRSAQVSEESVGVDLGPGSSFYLYGAEAQQLTNILSGIATKAAEDAVEGGAGMTDQSYRLYRSRGGQLNYGDWCAAEARYASYAEKSDIWWERAENRRMAMELDAALLH